jgi:hypothetical protein
VDVEAIRDRLAAQVRAAFPNAINVYSTMPAAPVVPAIIFAPATGTFLTPTAMGGVEDLELVATVLVDKTVDESAQDTLDAWLASSAGLRAAIDSGSTADWSFVVTSPVRGYGQYVFGTGDPAQSFLGFEIPTTVGS